MIIGGVKGVLILLQEAIIDAMTIRDDYIILSS